MKVRPSPNIPLVIVAALALGVASAGDASGQSVATTPVGAVRVSLAAAPAGGISVTTFTPVLRIPNSDAFVGNTRGTFTAVSTNSFTDASAGWAPNALSQAATPYFIKATSGNAAGAMWQISTSAANTDGSVTVLSLSGRDPVVSGVLQGDSYEIIPADTLGTLFAGLESAIGGPGMDAADTVRLHDGVAWRTFYYNNSPSVNQWREGSSSFNRNNFSIRPNSGIIYTRKGQAALSLTILGNVVTDGEKFVVGSTGVSFIGGVHPVDRQLLSLNLQTLPGFVNNTGNINAADKVKFHDGVAWRLLNFNGTQWREGSSSFNRNTLVVPAGTPVIIERGSAATGSASYVSVPAPYSF